MREKPFPIRSAESIGTAIRYYRAQAGLTQAQLAERAGVARPTITHLELGRENAQLRNLMRILRQLDVQLSMEKRARDE